MWLNSVSKALSNDPKFRASPYLRSIFWKPKIGDFKIFWAQNFAIFGKFRYNRGMWLYSVSKALSNDPKFRNAPNLKSIFLNSLKFNFYNKHHLNFRMKSPKSSKIFLLKKVNFYSVSENSKMGIPPNSDYDFFKNIIKWA